MATLTHVSLRSHKLLQADLAQENLNTATFHLDS